MLDINERLNNLEARLLDIEIRLGMIAPANTGPPRGAAARSAAPIATAGAADAATAGPPTPQPPAPPAPRPPGRPAPHPPARRRASPQKRFRLPS